MLQHRSARVLCLMLLGLQSVCADRYRTYYRMEVSVPRSFRDWRVSCNEQRPSSLEAGENTWFDLAYFVSSEEVNRAFKLVHIGEGLLIKPQLSRAHDYHFERNLFYDINLNERFKFPVSSQNISDEDRQSLTCSHLRSSWGKAEFVNADCYSTKALCMADKRIPNHETEQQYDTSLKYFVVTNNNEPDWDLLQKMCQKRGGDMATIKTIQDLLWASYVIGDTRVLIGAQKATNSSNYVNVDGTLLDVPPSFWNDVDGPVEPYLKYSCVTIIFGGNINFWLMETNVCYDKRMLCQYGLGQCKFDAIPRKLHSAHVIKTFQNVANELECMKKCNKGCGKCIMSFSPFEKGANCLQAGFSLDYYFTIENKNAMFESRQEFDSKWAVLVPKDGRAMQPRPTALWPLDNVARGANVMAPLQASVFACSTQHLQWTEPGPRSESRLRYPRGGNKSEEIPLGRQLSAVFTLGAWIKTDDFKEHGLPIFEGRQWQKSFSLLFAADEREELHLDTHYGSFHAQPSSDDVNTWRHVAMVCKNTSDFEFFVNGKAQPLLYRASLQQSHAFEMQALCLFGTCDNIPLHGSLACVSYFNSVLTSEAIGRVMKLCAWSAA